MVRFVLLIATTIALAGCFGGGSVTDNGRTIIDKGRTVIAEDQFYAYSFSLGSSITFEIAVEVHSGPSIDVLVMDSVNFQQFKDGRDFVHFPSCGGVAAQGFSRSCQLQSGSYYSVLDNSDRGETTPPFNAVNDGADTSWIMTRP